MPLEIIAFNFNSITEVLFAFEWKKELTVLQREKKICNSESSSLFLPHSFLHLLINYDPQTPKEFRIKWLKKVGGN